MAIYRGNDWTEYSAMEWEVLAQLHRCARDGRCRMTPISHYRIRLGDYETEVDYFYMEPANVCVYVDGPHHQHTIHAKRDVQVSNELRDYDYYVLRLPYDTYTVARRNEMVEQIIDVVNTRVAHAYTIPASWRADSRDE